MGTEEVFLTWDSWETSSTGFLLLSIGNLSELVFWCFISFLKVLVGKVFSFISDSDWGFYSLQDSLAEVEEKYKKAMVSNAQLDNEKTNFMYQVDTLKDALLELEEQLAESRRQYEEKSKVCKWLWHGK